VRTIGRADAASRCPCRKLPAGLYIWRPATEGPDKARQSINRESLKKRGAQELSCFNNKAKKQQQRNSKGLFKWGIHKVKKKMLLLELA
jgi:hypothetical protein